MIDPGLLKIMRCPETHQDLRVADAIMVDELNRQIAAGTLRNHAGRPVKDRLESGLVRADGKYLFPIRSEIPVMLMDEAIPLGD